MNTLKYIWDVSTSPYASPYLQGTQQFGTTQPIYLIDQLNGKRPALLNQEFLLNKKISFEIYPSALLDSNVLDAIDKRVSGKSVHDGLESFLRFLTEKRWDFNPLFYYVEHFAKSSSSDFRPNAIRRTESLLKLHSMDEQRFLQTGEIVPYPEAVEYYTKKFGVSTMSEVAEHQVDSFASRYDRDALRAMIDAIEIALIKMVLIQKLEHPKAPPERKFEEFSRFLREDLKIVLARELHLALHYFCDRAGKLLGIQSTTPIDRALDNLQSTAWDMYLLRFPEMFFSDSPDELCVAYVATQEKKLHELARLFTVERVFGSASDSITPQVSYDLTNLPDKVISEVSSLEIEQQSVLDLANRESVKVPEGMLTDLRKQLAGFCSAVKAV